jgi:hypothetical protein
MQKINIPNTDLYASRLALGTDYFGSTVSRDLSMQLMDQPLPVFPLVGPKTLADLKDNISCAATELRRMIFIISNTDKPRSFELD